MVYISKYAMHHLNVYRRTSEIGELKRDFDPDISKQQNMWLSKLVRAYPDLQYGIKNGEQRIGPRMLKVDGYSLLANTAFEFDGCFYHG